MSEMTLREQRLLKIGQFPAFWDYDLSVRLSNAEKLIRHPEGPNNKSPILYSLVTSYTAHAVNESLLKIYEVTEMIRMHEPSFGDLMPQELKDLRTIRNKMVTHLEENILDPKWRKAVDDLRDSNWKIIDQIRFGAGLILEKISLMNPPISSAKVSFLHEFGDAQIELLIAAASQAPSR